VRSFVGELAMEYPNYSCVEITMFLKTAGPRATGRLKFDHITLSICAPDGAVLAKVCTSIPVPSSPSGYIG
jgi:hypothetical protein